MGRQRHVWPTDASELIALQARLADAAAAALATEPWASPFDRPLVAGCFVTHAHRSAGPGREGDQAWAAAVSWRPTGGHRRSDDHLHGRPSSLGPRVADDVVEQRVVAGRARAPYVPGLLAARDGPVLAAALAALAVRPDVVLVDASGLDHPRGAGLAVHLGAVAGVPSVGVTRRPLGAVGPRPPLDRGALAPLQREGCCVAYWVCTRTGVQPLVAHAGWRTSPETAARVVLVTSTATARTPVPLEEARRAAREARSYGSGGPDPAGRP